MGSGSSRTAAAREPTRSGEDVPRQEDSTRLLRPEHGPRRGAAAGQDRPATDSGRAPDMERRNTRSIDAGSTAATTVSAPADESEIDTQKGSSEADSARVYDSTASGSTNDHRPDHRGPSEIKKVKTANQNVRKEGKKGNEEKEKQEGRERQPLETEQTSSLETEDSKEEADKKGYYSRGDQHEEEKVEGGVEDGEDQAEPPSASAMTANELLRVEYHTKVRIYILSKAFGGTLADFRHISEDLARVTVDYQVQDSICYGETGSGDEPVIAGILSLFRNVDDRVQASMLRVVALLASCSSGFRQRLTLLESDVIPRCVWHLNRPLGASAASNNLRMLAIATLTQIVAYNVPGLEQLAHDYVCLPLVFQSLDPASFPRYPLEESIVSARAAAIMASCAAGNPTLVSSLLSDVRLDHILVELLSSLRGTAVTASLGSKIGDSKKGKASGNMRLLRQVLRALAEVSQLTDLPFERPFVRQLLAIIDRSEDEPRQEGLRILVSLCQQGDDVKRYLFEVAHWPLLNMVQLASTPVRALAAECLAELVTGPCSIFEDISEHSIEERHFRADLNILLESQWRRLTAGVRGLFDSTVSGTGVLLIDAATVSRRLSEWYYTSVKSFVEDGRLLARGLLEVSLAPHLSQAVSFIVEQAAAAVADGRPELSKISRAYTRRVESSKLIDGHRSRLIVDAGGASLLLLLRYDDQNAYGKRLQTAAFRALASCSVSADDAIRARIQGQVEWDAVAGILSSNAEDCATADQQQGKLLEALMYEGIRLVGNVLYFDLPSGETVASLVEAILAVSSRSTHSSTSPRLQACCARAFRVLKAVNPKIVSRLVSIVAYGQEDDRREGLAALLSFLTPANLEMVQEMYGRCGAIRTCTMVVQSSMVETHRRLAMKVVCQCISQTTIDMKCFPPATAYKAILECLERATGQLACHPENACEFCSRPFEAARYAALSLFKLHRIGYSTRQTAGPGSGAGSKPETTTAEAFSANRASGSAAGSGRGGAESDSDRSIEGDLASRLLNVLLCAEESITLRYVAQSLATILLSATTDAEIERVFLPSIGTLSSGVIQQRPAAVEGNPAILAGCVGCLASAARRSAACRREIFSHGLLESSILMGLAAAEFPDLLSESCRLLAAMASLDDEYQEVASAEHGCELVALGVSKFVRHSSEACIALCSPEHDVSARMRVVQLGALLPLITQISSHVQQQHLPAVQAMTTLCQDAVIAEMAVDSGVIPPLCYLLRSRHVVTLTAVAGCLGLICSHSRHARVVFGDEGGALRIVVSRLLESGLAGLLRLVIEVCRGNAKNQYEAFTLGVLDIVSSEHPETFELASILAENDLVRKSILQSAAVGVVCSMASYASCQSLAAGLLLEMVIAKSDFPDGLDLSLVLVQLLQSRDYLTVIVPTLRLIRLLMPFRFNVSHPSVLSLVAAHVDPRLPLPLRTHAVAILERAFRHFDELKFRICSRRGALRLFRRLVMCSSSPQPGNMELRCTATACLYNILSCPRIRVARNFFVLVPDGDVDALADAGTGSGSDPGRVIFSSKDPPVDDADGGELIPMEGLMDPILKNIRLQDCVLRRASPYAESLTYHSLRLLRRICSRSLSFALRHIRSLTLAVIRYLHPSRLLVTRCAAMDLVADVCIRYDDWMRYAVRQPLLLQQLTNVPLHVSQMSVELETARMKALAAFIRSSCAAALDQMYLVGSEDGFWLPFLHSISRIRRDLGRVFDSLVSSLSVVFPKAHRDALFPFIAPAAAGAAMAAPSAGSVPVAHSTAHARPSWNLSALSRLTLVRSSFAVSSSSPSFAAAAATAAESPAATEDGDAQSKIYSAIFAPHTLRQIVSSCVDALPSLDAVRVLANIAAGRQQAVHDILLSDGVTVHLLRRVLVALSAIQDEDDDDASRGYRTRSLTSRGGNDGLDRGSVGPSNGQQLQSRRVQRQDEQEEVVAATLRCLHYIFAGKDVARLMPPLCTQILRILVESKSATTVTWAVTLLRSSSSVARHVFARSLPSKYAWDVVFTRLAVLCLSPDLPQRQVSGILLSPDVVLPFLFDWCIDLLLHAPQHGISAFPTTEEAAVAFIHALVGCTSLLIARSGAIRPSVSAGDGGVAGSEPGEQAASEVRQMSVQAVQILSTLTHLATSSCNAVFQSGFVDILLSDLEQTAFHLVPQSLLFLSEPHSFKMLADVAVAVEDAEPVVAQFAFRILQYLSERSLSAGQESQQLLEGLRCVVAVAHLPEVQAQLAISSAIVRFLCSLLPVVSADQLTVSNTVHHASGNNNNNNNNNSSSSSSSSLGAAWSSVMILSHLLSFCSTPADDDGCPDDGSSSAAASPSAFTDVGAVDLADMLAPYVDSLVDLLEVPPAGDGGAVSPRAGSPSSPWLIACGHVCSIISLLIGRIDRPGTLQSPGVAGVGGFNLSAFCQKMTALVRFLVVEERVGIGGGGAGHQNIGLVRLACHCLCEVSNRIYHPAAIPPHMMEDLLVQTIAPALRLVAFSGLADVVIASSLLETVLHWKTRFEPLLRANHGVSVAVADAGRIIVESTVHFLDLYVAAAAPPVDDGSPNASLVLEEDEELAVLSSKVLHMMAPLRSLGGEPPDALPAMSGLFPLSHDQLMRVFMDCISPRPSLSVANAAGARAMHDNRVHQEIRRNILHVVARSFPPPTGLVVPFAADAKLHGAWRRSVAWACTGGAGAAGSSRQVVLDALAVKRRFPNAFAESSLVLAASALFHWMHDCTVCCQVLEFLLSDTVVAQQHEYPAALAAASPTAGPEETEAEQEEGFRSLSSELLLKVAKMHTLTAQPNQKQHRQQLHQQQLLRQRMLDLLERILPLLSQRKCWCYSWVQSTDVPRPSAIVDDVSAAEVAVAVAAQWLELYQFDMRLLDLFSSPSCHPQLDGLLCCPWIASLLQESSCERVMRLCIHSYRRLDVVQRCLDYLLGAAPLAPLAERGGALSVSPRLPSGTVRSALELVHLLVELFGPGILSTLGIDSDTLLNPFAAPDDAWEAGMSTSEGSTLLLEDLQDGDRRREVSVGRSVVTGTAWAGGTAGDVLDVQVDLRDCFERPIHRTVDPVRVVCRICAEAGPTSAPQDGNALVQDDAFRNDAADDNYNGEMDSGDDASVSGSLSMAAAPGQQTVELAAQLPTDSQSASPLILEGAFCLTRAGVYSVICCVVSGVSASVLDALSSSAADNDAGPSGEAPEEVPLAQQQQKQPQKKNMSELELLGPPTKLFICPAEISPSHCLVLSRTLLQRSQGSALLGGWTSPVPVTAGSVHVVTVVMRDRFGNAVPRSPGPVQFVLTTLSELQRLGNSPLESSSTSGERSKYGVVAWADDDDGVITCTLQPTRASRHLVLRMLCGNRQLGGDCLMLPFGHPLFVEDGADDRATASFSAMTGSSRTERVVRDERPQRLSLEVLPAEIHLPSSRTNLLQAVPVMCTAGSCLRAVLALFDRYGNVVGPSVGPDRSSSIVVKLIGRVMETGSLETYLVQHLSQNNFELTMLPRLAGTTEISLAVNGTVIATTRTTVRPGVPHAPSFTAYGPGYRRMVVGVWNIFHVVARDRFGNLVDCSTQTLTCDVLLNNVPRSVGIVSRIAVGMWSVRYEVPSAGTEPYEMRIRVDGVDIRESPLRRHGEPMLVLVRPKRPWERWEEVTRLNVDEDSRVGEQSLVERLGFEDSAAAGHSDVDSGSKEEDPARAGPLQIGAGAV